MLNQTVSEQYMHGVYKKSNNKNILDAWLSFEQAI